MRSINQNLTLIKFDLISQIWLKSIYTGKTGNTERLRHGDLAVNSSGGMGSQRVDFALWHTLPTQFYFFLSIKI